MERRIEAACFSPGPANALQAATFYHLAAVPCMWEGHHITAALRVSCARVQSRAWAALARRLQTEDSTLAGPAPKQRPHQSVRCTRNNLSEAVPPLEEECVALQPMLGDHRKVCAELAATLWWIACLPPITRVTRARLFLRSASRHSATRASVQTLSPQEEHVRHPTKGICTWTLQSHWNLGRPNVQITL